MDSATTAQLGAALIGIVITVLWRLIDRYLPDPNVPSPPRATRGGPTSG